MELSFPNLQNDLSTVITSLVSSVYAWVLIAVGVPFAFYLIKSLRQILALDRGESVKNISALTAYMDRRRQEKIREKYIAAEKAEQNEEILAHNNELYAAQLDNTTFIEK